MEKEFYDFLKSDKSIESFSFSDKRIAMVSKVSYNNKIDILYVLDNYGGNPFDLKSSFEYGGIYNKEQNKLFDLNYHIKSHILKWEYDDSRDTSIDELYKTINKDMNDKIKEMIECSKNEIFKVDEIEQLPALDDEDVITFFMEGVTSDTLEDSFVKYNTKNPQDLLEYLTDRDTFVKVKSKDFILDKSLEIVEDLATSEKRRKTLKQIENNPNHPYHKIKKIVDAIKENGCVTVNVTINKNDIEQTFKYDAGLLKNGYNNNYLPSFCIKKVSDRDLFSENFGKWEDFDFKDITKITYGKKTIYEDEKVKSKNEEEICL